MPEQSKCGARMAHKICDAPVVEGKKRCYRHGGAPGSGAPKGNQNAYKHGIYTKAWKDEGRLLDRRFRKLTKLLKKIAKLPERERSLILNLPLPPFHT